jgi:hypothetical protein
MEEKNLQALKKPEDLGRPAGHTITAIAFGLPIIPLAVFGYSLGNGYTAAAFATIWIGLFVATSLRFVRKRTFVVVERFGYFWDVKFAGPRILIPWIDNEVMRDNFLQKSVELYQGEGDKNVEIDFVDGSAPIRAAAWYQIGNPDNVEHGDLDAVRNQVLYYTYRVKADERQSRVAEIFEGAFRPLLETVTIAEAQAKAEAFAKQAIDGVSASPGTEEREGARKALAEIGVYPFPGKGIIVRDVVLPLVIVELRERELRGRSDAQEAISRSASYWQPLVHMKNGLASAGLADISGEEISRLFLAQKGFETLQKTGSNVSLIASDIDSLQKVITVGATSKPKGDAK